MINRGDQLEAIFRDDRDREMFLQTLEESCLSFDWLIHSFVLMNNHYHLVVIEFGADPFRGCRMKNHFGGS